MGARMTMYAMLSMSALTMAACEGCGSAAVAYGDSDGTDVGTADDGGVGSASCIDDADCGAGRRCTEGVCTPAVGDDDGSDAADGGPGDAGTGGCMTNADCPPGQACDEGACHMPGGGCTSDADCAPGTCSDAGTCTPADGGSGGSGDGGSDDPGDAGTGGCMTNADCAPAQVCDHGTCVCDGDGDDGHDKACRHGKMLVCHYPPGHPEGRHDICVGNAAVPAHQAHGDALGDCP